MDQGKGFIKGAFSAAKKAAPVPAPGAVVLACTPGAVFADRIGPPPWASARQAEVVNIMSSSMVQMTDLPQQGPAAPPAGAPR